MTPPPPRRAIVFPTGLYAPNGRDSVSICTRDWMIGLHELGVPVFALDMSAQGERSRIVRLARTAALVGSAYGWPRMSLNLASAVVASGGVLAPAIRLARRVKNRGGTERHQSATGVCEKDADASLVASILLQPDAPRRLPIDEVVCVLTAYDLLFAPRWVTVWRRAIAAQLRRHFPGALIRWCVHVVSESTRVAPSLVCGADLCDEVWTPSDFNAAALRRSGLRNPRLFKMGEAIDTALYCPGVQPAAIPGRRGFAFMTASQYVPAQARVSATREPTHELALMWNQARKAADLTIRAFLEEFRSDEDVCLVVKSTGDPGVLAAALKDLLARLGFGEDRLRQLIPVGGWTAAADMPGLYAAADAFLLVSRGEGWGRPLMEAMAVGKPAIGTNFGGNTEFMNEANSFLVDYTLVSVASVIGRKFEVLGDWAEPSVPHLRATLRDVFSNRVAARRRGDQAARDVYSGYSRRAIAQRMLDLAERNLVRQ